MIRINCWSGPRNVSTALMYAFRQRSDTVVFDEPLYAHYLKVTGREHPGREEVLASQSTDAGAVVRDVILGGGTSDVRFYKQMAHHLVAMDTAFLSECHNLLLTRDPTEMLPSLAIQLPDVTLADTGLEVQIELLETIISAGERPLVIVAGDLLTDPERGLAAICAHAGIEFDPSMLTWPAGPKPEDGVWAPHWYHRVHTSTGFDTRLPERRKIPPRIQPILDAAVPLFERLREYA